MQRFFEVSQRPPPLRDTRKTNPVRRSALQRLAPWDEVPTLDKLPGQDLESLVVGDLDCTSTTIGDARPRRCEAAGEPYRQSSPLCTTTLGACRSLTPVSSLGKECPPPLFNPRFCRIIRPRGIGTPYHCSESPSFRGEFLHGGYQVFFEWENKQWCHLPRKFQQSHVRAERFDW